MPTKQRRQRGTGSLFQRDDGVWIGAITLWTPDGRRRRKTVSSKNYKTAQRRLAELQKQLDNTGDLPTGALTVTQWVDYWLEHIASKRIRPRTLVTYRGHLTNYVKPAIGRRRLDALLPQHIRLVHTLIAEKGLSSTTALHAHAALVKCLNDAVREGVASRNPAELVDPPRRAVTDLSALTAQQGIELLLKADKAEDPMTSRWAMALLTGARQGECLGLEVDRILDDRIDISWQLQRLNYSHGCGKKVLDEWPCGTKRGGNCPKRSLKTPPGFEIRHTDSPGLFLTRPKTKKGQRVIPLVEPLKTILAKHTEGRTGLVWTRSDGSPVDPKDDNHAWHAALERAELPNVRLHDARRTTATLLLEAGVDAHVVTQILGQSSVITARGYQNVSLALATDAMKALGRALTESPSA